jgi:hypothetical protein
MRKHLLDAVRRLRQAERQIEHFEAADGRLLHCRELYRSRAHALFGIFAMASSCARCISSGDISLICAANDHLCP